MLYKSNDMPPILTMQHVPIQQTNSQPLVNNSIPLPVPAPQQNVQLNLNNNFANSLVQDVDLRSVDPRLNRSLDQDMRTIPAAPVVTSNPQPSIDPNFQRSTRPFPTDPRQRPVDPRTAKAHPQPLVQPAVPVPTPQAAPQVQQNRIPAGIPNDASDQEKAALIMQVLQLSDEQISMLPLEQRTSILVLKEQIAKSTGR